MPADQFGAKPNSRPAPTPPPQRVSSPVVRDHEARGNISGCGKRSDGNGRTALDIEQNVVGGPADLTGEQAEGIDASTGCGDPD